MMMTSLEAQITSLQIWISCAIRFEGDSQVVIFPVFTSICWLIDGVY